MDGSYTFSLTQMIVAWTILGVLSIWLIIFAVLALRSLSIEKKELEDLFTPSRSFPAISMQTTLQNGNLSSTSDEHESGQFGPLLHR